MHGGKNPGISRGETFTRGKKKRRPETRQGKGLLGEGGYLNITSPGQSGREAGPMRRKKTGLRQEKKAEGNPIRGLTPRGDKGGKKEGILSKIKGGKGPTRGRVSHAKDGSDLGGNKNEQVRPQPQKKTRNFPLGLWKKTD